MNRLFVNRKVGKEEKRAGYINGAVASDETSIAEIGLLESEEDVPVYWSDALCQKFADAQIQIMKDPKRTLILKDVPWGYYPIGLWKIITQPKRRTNVLNECESTSGWVWDSERVTFTADIAEKVFGARSLKAVFDEGAIGASWTYDLNFVVIDPILIRLMYKAGRIGQRVLFGYGETSYLENTVELYGYSTQWRPRIIDISSFSKGKIGQIGFRIEDASTGEGAAEVGIGTPGFPILHSFSIERPEDFRFDKIEIISTASQHDIIELVNVKGKCRDGEKSMELTFGARSVGLDGEIVGLARSLKTTKLALRESN